MIPNDNNLVVSTADTIYAKVDLLDAPAEMITKLKSCTASPSNDLNSPQLELFSDFGADIASDIDVEFMVNCQGQTASFNFGGFAFKKQFTMSGKHEYVVQND